MSTKKESPATLAKMMFDAGTNSAIHEERNRIYDEFCEKLIQHTGADYAEIFKNIIFNKSKEQTP